MFGELQKTFVMRLLAISAVLSLVAASLALPFLPAVGAQQGNQNKTINLSGKWKTDDGQVVIEQNGQNVKATFVSGGNCKDGEARDFYFQGSLSGNSLTGTMQVCTRNQQLLQDCHLQDPYTAKIIKATVSENTIEGQYVPDYITYDMRDGHYVNCVIKPGAGTPTGFTLTRECAIPINFHETGSSDAGNGVLHFDYEWQSSTGKLSDLSDCLVGEAVDYESSDFPLPSPPFPADLDPDNPTEKSITASSGVGQDNHSTGTFVAPYKAASFTATQIYRYSCPCHKNGEWETLMGPHSIVRSVTQNADKSWRFTITKTGQSATINPLP